MTARYPFLDEPIPELGFTEEFCDRCARMGFGSLADIIAEQPARLVTLPAFSYHWLTELCSFLSRHKAIHLLQPIPGNNIY